MKDTKGTTYMEHFEEVAKIEEEAKNTLMREWYMNEYPSDYLGLELRKDATFYDLFEALDHRKNVYDLFGVNDSIVRSRLFGELAEIMHVDYHYIYDQWLMGK